MQKVIMKDYSSEEFNYGKIWKRFLNEKKFYIKWCSWNMHYICNKIKLKYNLLDWLKRNLFNYRFENKIVWICTNHIQSF